MKNILLAVFALFLIVLMYPLNSVWADEDNAILFVTSPHKTELVGNGTSIDLVLNTMGTHVKEIHAEFVIRGLHENPGYGTHLSKLNGFIFDTYYESQERDGLRVTMNIQSENSDGVNGGSGTMTIFNAAFSPTQVGVIEAYIDTDRTFVRYADREGTDFRNYSPSTRSYTMNVISENAPQVGEVSPTQKLNPTPVTYDRDYEQLAKEFAEVKKEVENQGQRISFLEQVVIALQQFIERLRLLFR